MDFSKNGDYRKNFGRRRQCGQCENADDVEHGESNIGENGTLVDDLKNISHFVADGHQIYGEHVEEGDFGEWSRQTRQILQKR